MKRFLSVILLSCLALAATPSTHARDSLYIFNRHIIQLPVAPDSADVERLNHKAFWRASAETFGFNMGLWAFDRYIQKGHFAYIS